MKTISLNGKWKCKSDIKNIGIKNNWYNPDVYNLNKKNLINIEIPKSFNLLKGFENFEGTFWHFYQFDLNEERDLNKNDFQIRFKGANYNSNVWVNGKFLGEHSGGFTPFHFNINNLIKERNNFLVVRVDNKRKRDQVPAISFDWFNYGGIYRDVDLLILDKNRLDRVCIKTTIITKQKSRIDVSYNIIGEIPLKWQILDESKKDILYEGTAPEISGKGGFNLIINNPKLWSPSTPNLYYLRIYNISQEIEELLIFNTYFGIRQIEINGFNLILNKEKIFLKGASLHEEYMPYGRTIPYEKRKEDILNFKSLGFNAIRTAHYSHDEDLVEIADKVGILILEEIPVYWSCDFKNSQTYETAANMLSELIWRDINHPSVIWWSVGNEVPLHRKDCSNFIKSLMNLAKEIDKTRLVTVVSRKLIPDLTRRSVDIATINTYFGWYFPHEKLISFVLDLIRTPVLNKPWIYTEFGAGAKYGFHADWNKQLKFSEEKQLHVLDYTIRTINSKDYFAGWFIWIYRDFRAPKRLNKYQQGYNRKGIVSGEHNEKKLIYYRIPKIIDQKRKTYNTKMLGILIWIVFFPFSYVLFTRIINQFLEHRVKKASF
ncbi:MAG: glycoside hydrolase family 2 protein [Candidatus Hermodarchaeota archaeon]